MWLPWFENINMENREKCKQTEKSDVLKIIPNKNFSFKRNPYTDHINAFLFEGPKQICHENVFKNKNCGCHCTTGFKNFKSPKMKFLEKTP